MRFPNIYSILFFMLMVISINAQLQLDSNNNLTLNSSPIVGGEFTIGVDEEFGGLFLNSSSTDKIGVLGFALNGSIGAFTGFNHDTGGYFVSIAGSDQIGITLDATTIFNTLLTDELMLKDKLLVGDSGNPLLTVDAVNNRMYYNYDQDIGSADFVLNSVNPNSFGGMYINSENNVNGRPFYGYSTGGIAKAFHYFDEALDSWLLNVDLEQVLEINNLQTRFSNNFNVQPYNQSEPTFYVKNGTYSKMYFNTSTDIGSSDFVLNSTNGGGFGGMYINVNDSNSSAAPFYGYAINGTGNVFHYWNEDDDYWKLFHTSDHILQANQDEVIVNGSIQVGNKTGTKPEGTIYYNGFHFYGITDGGVIRQLDNTTNAQDLPTKQNAQANQIELLKKENKSLLEKLNKLEDRLDKLESLIDQ